MPPEVKPLESLSWIRSFIKRVKEGQQPNEHDVAQIERHEENILAGMQHLVIIRREQENATR